MKSLFLIPALGVCGLVLGADEVLCAGVNGAFSPDGVPRLDAEGRARLFLRQPVPHGVRDVEGRSEGRLRAPHLGWVSTKGAAFKGPAVGDIRYSLWKGRLSDPEQGTCCVRPPMERSGVSQPAVSPDGTRLV